MYQPLIHSNKNNLSFQSEFLYKDWTYRLGSGRHAFGRMARKSIKMGNFNMRQKLQNDTSIC